MSNGTDDFGDSTADAGIDFVENQRGYLGSLTGND